MKDINYIRNFCIIAHIDHGKTTLSDCLLEFTNTIQTRDMKNQLLDSMDLEKEKGITIKCHPVSMYYNSNDGYKYLLNLIDTPGHVDFSYEVSRSLNACEGALLLIDASQGIEAQTIANAHLAINQGLEIIPIINKIDLPSSDPETIKNKLEDILAISSEDVILASAKNRIGIKEILETIVNKLKKPRGDDYNKVRCLIFDSKFDNYKGVICYIRIFSGMLKEGDEVIMMNHNIKTSIKEIGIFTPSMYKTKTLTAGMVGYIITSLKEVSEVKTGDTVTLFSNPAKEMLKGYKEVRPLVFSGIYPLDNSEYTKLKSSLERLQLNDSALVFQSESSIALGFGFRCGFLGLLHMEIVQERIRREYNVDIINTYPSVVYKLIMTDGSLLEIDNPANLPSLNKIKEINEPIILANIKTPKQHIGDLLALISEKRGICNYTETIDFDNILLICRIPLNEILIDFNDRLKSLTHGYGSMDYEMDGYLIANLVKMEILVHGEVVDAFSSIVDRSKAEIKGRSICSNLKELLPRQMFQIPIQAVIGNKVIARETLSAMRKDVTAKCYGGDISRKKKLLEKQKKGKEKMKKIGTVSIPQDAFIKILKSKI